MRLDAGPWGLQSDPVEGRPMRDRSICFTTNQTVTKILQLEARPRSRENQCVQPRMVSGQGLWMVSDTPMPVTDQALECQGCSLEYSALVPDRTGSTGGLSLPASQGGASNVRAGIHNEIPELIAWLISGNPLRHKEFHQMLL